MVCFLRRLEEEKKKKVEDEKRKKIEQEKKRLKEQQEYELEMEKIKLNKIEEEKKRIEMERQAAIQQEENERKALLIKDELKSEQGYLEEKNMVEEENFSDSVDVEVLQHETKSKEDVLYEHLNNLNVIEANENLEEGNSSNQIFVNNFEKLVNEAIYGENKFMTNIALQLENIHTESLLTINNEIDAQNSSNFQETANKAEISDHDTSSTPRHELLGAQKELFNEWYKHNKCNFFENIRQDYELKLKELQSDANLKSDNNLKSRPRTGKTKQFQNIPESLLLKKSNKNSLNEIGIIYFHALTSYSLNTLELCTNLAFLVLTNSQITSLDGLQNCVNLKYINAQVSVISHK